MKKTIALAVIAATGLVTAASADNLILVDLSVANQVTVSATSGLASADSSASNFTGFLLEGFYGSPVAVGAGTVAGSGDLVTFNETSDGSPLSFSGTGNAGLNFWSIATTGLSTTAGVQAFSGSATFALDAANYAAMLAGNASGDIYMGADTDDDIGGFGVVNIGTWSLVPAPSAMAMLGLGGIVAGRRRR